MNKIALFIDTDNVSPKQIPNILVNLNQEGNVIYKRAYGDYGRHPNWNQVCVDNDLFLFINVLLFQVKIQQI